MASVGLNPEPTGLTVNAADVSVIAEVAVLRTSNGTPSVNEFVKPVGAGTVLGPQAVLRGRG